MHHASITIRNGKRSQPKLSHQVDSWKTALDSRNTSHCVIFFTSPKPGTLHNHHHNTTQQKFNRLPEFDAIAYGLSSGFIHPPPSCLASRTFCWLELNFRRSKSKGSPNSKPSSCRRRRAFARCGCIECSRKWNAHYHINDGSHRRREPSTAQQLTTNTARQDSGNTTSTALRYTIKV